MSDLIKSGTPTMSSREIADLVESRHDKVKQSIERLVEKGVISQPPLGSGTKAANGVVEKVYLVGKRDSYIVVAQLCPEFTARLVDRWQELELQQPNDSLADLPPEQRALVAIMVDNAKIKARQEELAAEQTVQQESIKRIEARQSAFEEGHSFFTVVGFCALRGVKLVMSDMQKLGKMAGKFSREQGIPIDKVRDVRYGVVNSYHESTLEAAMAEVHGGM